ncbi:MAG TPA: hypothetical protein VFI33_13890 [Puia sp.]|nr:hypothetical protein [Puia sp.]
MIAYSQKNLDNLSVRDQVRDALDAGCISAEENTRIRTAYPVDFYMPNFFICIGLFVLTTIIALCSFGFFILINSRSEDSLNVLTIFFGLICYGALEIMVYKFRHFRSGVDYALLWMSASLLFAGIYMAVNNMSFAFQCITVCSISLFFALRFANHLMALIAYIALVTWIINTGTEPDENYQRLLPFIIMAVSIAACFLSFRLYEVKKCRHYRESLANIKVASLVSFYLAGNYFAVSEMNNSIFNHTGNAENISIAWLFWILTVSTPLFYIYRGLRKKDHLFIWTGLGLVAATVLTVRYYYHVLPVEWALIIGGLVMIVIAYVLTRYLKTPRHGFTSLESTNKHLLENLHIESLIIAETFGGSTAAKAPPNDFQFGGGSGGGGGAGGQY